MHLAVSKYSLANINSIPPLPVLYLYRGPASWTRLYDAHVNVVVLVLVLLLLLGWLVQLDNSDHP